MSPENILQRSFKWWKIALAILIGLSIVSWMLYRSLSAEQYIEVEAGTGSFSWVDSNKNSVVDLQDPTEFIQKEGGNYKLLGFREVLTTIHWSNSSVFFLILALCFVVCRDLFYMWRIKLLTKDQLSWKASFYVIMIWEFASAVSPGVVGGATVAMFILNREKIPLGRSTAIVFITALMDNLFYVLMIPFVFLFIRSVDLFPVDSPSSSSVSFIFWSGFTLILFICVFLYLSIFRYPRLATRFLGFIFTFPPLQRWKEKALETGRDIELCSKELREESRFYWLKVFLITCASWISRYLVINAILQAFIGLGFFQHIIILGKQLILWLFMLVSPTPGGSGVAEYAFGELLAPFAQSAMVLVALALVWRLISYFPYLFVGVFLLPRWIQRTQRKH